MLTGPKVGDQPAAQNESPSWIKRALRLEWLGQTVASICWIVSVFTYGIEKTGDWLQLMAASAWFVANIAAIAKPGIQSSQNPQ